VWAKIGLVLALGVFLVGQPGPVAGQTLPHWIQVSTPVAPGPRAQYGMAADAHGNVYLFGGRAPDNTALSDFWRYSAVTHTWQSLRSFNTAGLIEPHLAVDAGGNVFEFGGIGAGGFAHFSPDGHSYGLYEYLPAQNIWIDRTPPDPALGRTWPPGREDFGFTYDPGTGQFFVFAGEGQGDISLNDMWSYDEQDQTWTQLSQFYTGGGGQPIAPREIYALSDDYHGHLYLFGGAYLAPTMPRLTPPVYANDLWRYTISSKTWSLLAGVANGYDPAMPLPRHYYGQACDPAGNFYLLDGYLSAETTPPYFAHDLFSGYGRNITLPGASTALQGITTEALDDFWQYNRASARWQDLSDELGGLRDLPAIPYVMVLDTQDLQFLTFGGYLGPPGTTLTMTSDTWVYPLPPAATGAEPVTK
jgi:hypothetical protein